MTNEEKSKKLYRTIKPLVESVLLLRQSEEGDVNCFLPEETVLPNGEEVDKALFTEETIKIKKAGWGLIARIEDVSARYNQLGMKLANDSLLIENYVRYLWKYSSFIDLKFETDESGHERIAKEQWLDIVGGTEPLSPNIILAIYRLVKRYN